MRLNALRDFLAVAGSGSLRAGARQLGVAQPAMTRSIQELERELGSALFDRRVQGVVLTPLGEVFRRRAQAVRDVMQLAQVEIDELKGLRQGNLRICMSTGAHILLLPDALLPFRQRYPDVRLEVIDSVLPPVEKELLAGTVDFYIGPSHDEVAGELLVEHLLDNERVVVCRIGHPLAAATSLSELVGAEWVTTSVTHRAADEISPVFRRLGLREPPLAVQTHAALTSFFMVAYSDLLMMLPIQWTQSPPFCGQLHRIPVQEKLEAPPLCIVRRPSLPLTPAGEHFCDMVRRTAVHRRQSQDS